MNPETHVRRLGLTLALCGLVSLAAGRAAAQTTTGTIRGTITDSVGGAIADAEVQARHTGTGVVRSTRSRQDGSYILPGLPPASYELSVRHIGHGPQARSLRVQVGATVVVDFVLGQRVVELEAVVVSGAPVAVETQTSEIATNVTPEQIDNLPSSSRNFLDLVLLAPGTNVQNERINGVTRTFSAGAQAAEQTNLFIDGVSYKNELIRGGSVGQDRSRGNPFPRNTVREYRVLTQNYKAEYQKASSAIITAVTKSGGNTWEGNAFFAYQDKGLVALDTFQRRDKKLDPTFREPDYRRYLAGISLGGPLIRDRLHVFAAYEGNYQDRSNQVNIVPPTGFPALDTIDFAGRNGFFESPFRSTLLFGKLSLAAGSGSSFELSYNNRHERDTRDFGGNRPLESGVRFRNDVSTALLKFSHVRDAWLNEAQVSYLRARDNPSPVPGNDPVNRFYVGAFCCAQIGPNITIQDFKQQRIGLRNDLTYSGVQAAGQHVVKLGLNIDFSSYRILKRNGVIPRFVYEENDIDGAGVGGFAIPNQVEFRAGNPNFLADNTQVGLYIQDDWSPTPQLTLNLGIRWDYETRMINFDYVTPQPIVDSLTKYADRLFLPIDPDRYFTDGTQRSRFKGAFQPRVGFSYALDRAGKTTLFGGFGIFYDRTLFDIAIEEEFAQRQPLIIIRFRQPGNTAANRVDWDDRFLSGRAALDSLRLSNPAAGFPEVKLLPNDLRPPRSRHFSAGVRQLIGPFALELAYTGVRSSNVFTFYWANQNFTCPERSFSVAGCFVNNPIPGFSTILLGTNNGKTWYDALQIKVDRPYSRDGAFGWGAGLAYTLAERETKNFNDDFSFPNPVDYPRQVRNDERHRLVVNWIVDIPYAWGIQFGGIFIFGSGVDQDVGDRFGGPANPFEPGGFDTPAFKNLDLRLRKEFPAFRGSMASITVDLFNVFNTQNLSNFITANRADPNFGNARQVLSDPRRLQLGVEYAF